MGPEAAAFFYTSRLKRTDTSICTNMYYIQRLLWFFYFFQRSFFLFVCDSVVKKRAARLDATAVAS